MRNMNSAPNRNRVFVASLIILLGGVSLSACSGKEKPAGEGSGFTFTFDDLGGGDPIIQVYAGPGESTADKTPTGTYNDGDVVNDPECRTDGRNVPSHPELGEQSKGSDEWVRLQRDQYATMTYGHVSPSSDQLQKC